ncbi:ubiquitin-like domain-containing protein CIP73 isoform X2 [Malania oleifera]|uniref:ubiquitin-like domain-containing protein CIP73 isoform X2 n=1 Tax=Malania oleifera TaxID=397392 RepID=UPI0025AE344A|nr:ubiquitin-like domain-containing protein CIP73 isoform X2 [Malania oleifera]
MGSSGASSEVVVSSSEDAECSEATVEIKIKTLDSQTYTLRVDKCMPVPALKEQIATVTGVLSEQQRLICRGKVLKDDQLLSAYHVEDGHTLHLVVRQPIPSSSEPLPDHPGADLAAGIGSGQNNQTGPSVLVGTFNISEQGDGILPDFHRIVSAVLSSFGAANIGSGREGADLREHFRRHGLSGLRDSSGQQSDQATARGHSNPMNGASMPSAVVPLDHLPPLVIPDALTTLSQYLSHMRHEFSSSELALGGHGNNSQATGTRGRDGQEPNAASHVAARQGGLPTPASLAEVMLSTRQILIEQARECLSQLARQIEEHANVTDPSARMTIQSNAMRYGDLLQKLGALLFELGRTTMTLRMGQAPADAVVNAGPAVFITTSGPNPMMVQPLPFQPGTSFGTIPLGSVQPGSGFSGGTPGSGFLPRNIDIRIRTASVNPGEPTVAQQTLGQDSQAISSHAHFVNQATAVPEGPSSTREPEVRVVPIRTLVAAVPAPLRRIPSDSSHSSVGLFYPVLARIQHVASGNLSNARTSQTSDEHLPTGLDTERQQSSEATVQQENNAFPERDGTTSTLGAAQDGQGSSTQIHGSLDQLLRTLFPGEQIHVGNVNFQGAPPSSVAEHVGTTEAGATVQEAAPAVADGLFLSNVLHQIMPFISQGAGMGSNIASPDSAFVENSTVEDSSTQVNSDIGTSRRQSNPPFPPNSKRQKVKFLCNVEYISRSSCISSGICCHIPADLLMRILFSLW